MLLKAQVMFYSEGMFRKKGFWGERVQKMKGNKQEQADTDEGRGSYLKENKK